MPLLNSQRSDLPECSNFQIPMVDPPGQNYLVFTVQLGGKTTFGLDHQTFGNQTQATYRPLASLGDKESNTRPECQAPDAKHSIIQHF